MRKIATLAAAAVLAQAAPAIADVKGSVSASSPGGKVSVTLSSEGEGRPVYTVSRNGKPILSPSRLGFLFTDVAKLDRRIEITGTETRDFDETWTQPWGEWSTIRNHYRELRVHFKETKGLGRVYVEMLHRSAVGRHHRGESDAAVAVGDDLGEQRVVPRPGLVREPRDGRHGLRRVRVRPVSSSSSSS